LKYKGEKIPHELMKKFVTDIHKDTDYPEKKEYPPVNNDLITFNIRFIKSRKEKGLIIAKTGPKSEYVAKIESIPVVGVDIKNETVAPLLEPSLSRCVATGITPQEHKGKGIPIILAFNIDKKLGEER
jgi:hypothetical protein